MGTSLIPASTASTGLMPVQTAIDPATDLRNKQITPGAMLDRFKLANDQFDTYANATTPAYQAALRDATRAAAGAGRLGSGLLRTSYGDLANTRQNALDTERQTLFQNALTGSVNDAQTQFEDLLRSQGQLSGMQNQAFNQAISGATLQEALTSGAFNRALQQLSAGSTGSPIDTQLGLSQLYGGQSAASGNALSSLLQSLMSQSRTSPTTGTTPSGVQTGTAQYGSFG